MVCCFNTCIVFKCANSTYFVHNEHICVLYEHKCSVLKLETCHNSTVVEKRTHIIYFKHELEECSKALNVVAGSPRHLLVEYSCMHW